MTVIRATRALFCGAAVLLAAASTGLAQQPIRPVPLTPFGDGQDSVLMENLAYRVGTTSHVILVPAGFVTDFASTPRAIWSVIPPAGHYQQAAIVHDFLYWEQGCTREQADALLRVAMAESRVAPAQRDIIWSAVRSFGSSAWAANARAKAEGQPRVIPASALPIPALVTWAEYRQKLKSEGLRAESTPTSAPEYCTAAALVNLDAPE